MTDEKIDEIINRGVINVIPDKASLKKALAGKKLNVYLGIDPTATKIHLGHAVPLLKLQALAEMGHHVTLLIGDFTALVGDTSDKESERPVLTPKEIEENFKTYKKQAAKILDFSKIKIRNNSEWLANLTYAELISIKQKFSLNDFIGRELIRKRLEKGARVRMDETEYPVMQGYDSYFMDTDLQIGAADQTFNMQAGRTLQKLLRNKDSYVLATDYLSGTDGTKMSKSLGNAIWLTDTPRQIFGKIMSITDADVIPYFTLATRVPNGKIKEFEQRLKKKAERIEVKKILAEEIVTMLYSDKEAADALTNFESTVQKKQIPDDVATFEMAADEHITITELLVKAGLATSKSEAKRLVDGKSVEVDSDLVDSPFEEIVPEDNMIIKAGKRKYIRIKLK